MAADKQFTHKNVTYYFVKRGKVYHARILGDITDEDGRRKVAKSKSTKETNLARAISTVNGWIEHGKLAVSPTDLEAYLTDFWDRDKSTYIKDRERAEKPYSGQYLATNASVLKKHCIPYFKKLGVVELHQLTTQNVRQWLIDLAADDTVTTRTANRARQALFTALRWAEQEQLIHSAPVGVRPAREPESSRKPFTLTEVKKLLYDTAWTDERVRVAAALAFDTGMRLGEVRGLRWHNVHDDGIAVVENYVDSEAHRFPDTRGTKPPKNNKPRSVHLPVSELTAQLMAELREASPWKGDRESFVFYDNDSPNRPMSLDTVRYAMRAATKAAGVAGKGKTFHSLRHAAISVWGPYMAPGERLAYFGHAGMAIQERYTHSTEEGRKALAGIKSNILPFQQEKGA